MERVQAFLKKSCQTITLVLLVNHTQKFSSDSFWFTSKNSVYVGTLFFFALFNFEDLSEYKVCVFLNHLEFFKSDFTYLFERA